MRRDYSGWTVERFKEEVEALSVKSRKELRNKDTGLYCKSLSAGWLDVVFGEPANRPHHDFSGWTVERFKEEVVDLDVKNRKELQQKDEVLYRKGLSAGWLDIAFGPNRVVRDYSGWTAKRFKREVEALGVETRGELLKKDNGLYIKGLREGWLDAVLGEPLQRDYSGWTVERFKVEVEALGVKSRSELSKKDCGLYNKGLHEGWLGAVLGEPLNRDYSSWTVERYKREVEALGVKGRKDLETKDVGLYSKGRITGWLNNVFGKSGCKPSRDYSGWTTEKYKREVEALGVKGRRELQKKDIGLYRKGCKEGWLGAVFGAGRVVRDHSGLTVEHFKEKVEALGVKSRADLINTDRGLYRKGHELGWLGIVFGEPVNRDYSDWTVERYTQEVENLDVKSRSELEKKDSGLYCKGLKEGWLDVVFGEPLCRDFSDLTVESYKNEVEVLGVKSRGELQKKDQGLYNKGFREGWFDVVFGEPVNRDYSGWTVERYKREVKSLDLKSRIELKKKDSGLYCKGLNEGWLDVVFGEPLRRDYSDWTLERYKHEVESLGVRSRRQLYDEDCGLYDRCRKMGWLDIIFPKSVGSLDSLLQDYVADGLAGKVEGEK